MHKTRAVVLDIPVPTLYKTRTMTHHLETTVRPLLGKTLYLVEREDVDCVRLGFTDGTTVRIHVKGDCCSTSVFYGIDFRGELGGKLTGITEGVRNINHGDIQAEPADDEKTAIARMKAEGIDMGYGDYTSFDCLSIWNVVVRTDRGSVILRHINDSNGYYDGDTSYTISPPRGYLHAGL